MFVYVISSSTLVWGKFCMADYKMRNDHESRQCYSYGKVPPKTKFGGTVD